MMLKTASGRQSVKFGAPTRVSSRQKAYVVKCRSSEDDEVSTIQQSEGLLGSVLSFFNATDFDLKETPLYRDKIKQVVDNKYFQMSTGFKELPETINGRAAMIGFVVAALGELAGKGSVLNQLSGNGPITLAFIAILIAASVVPVVKGTEGGYLDSLRDTYTLPDGAFTEMNERVNGRLAMIGFGSLVLVELLLGRALL